MLYFGSYVRPGPRASEKRKLHAKKKRPKKRVRSPRSQVRKTTPKKPASRKPTRTPSPPGLTPTQLRILRAEKAVRTRRARVKVKREAALRGWETRRKRERAETKAARARAKKAAETRKKRSRPKRREVDAKIRRLEKANQALERERQVERRKRERAEKKLEKLRTERKPLREKKSVEKAREERAAERLLREQEEIEKQRRETILAQERLRRQAKAIPTSKKEQDKWYSENFQRLKARFDTLLAEARKRDQIRPPRDGFRYTKIDSPKTKGYVLSVTLDLELTEQNVEEILYRVSQAAATIAGRSPHRYANWMASFYISSLAPDVKGYGFEKLAGPDPDAWRFQAQGILPTGLWTSRASMLEKARAILEGEMSTEHTVIHVHYATVSHHDRKTEKEQVEYIRSKRREKRSAAKKRKGGPR